MVSLRVTIALAASLGFCLFVVLLGSMRNPEIERLLDGDRRVRKYARYAGTRRPARPGWFRH